MKWRATSCNSCFCRTAKRVVLGAARCWVKPWEAQRLCFRPWDGLCFVHPENEQQKESPTLNNNGMPVLLYRELVSSGSSNLLETFLIYVIISFMLTAADQLPIPMTIRLIRSSSLRSSSSLSYAHTGLGTQFHQRGFVGFAKRACQMPTLDRSLA